MVKGFKSIEEINEYIDLTQIAKTKLIELEDIFYKLDNSYSVKAHIDNMDSELRFLLFTKYQMERGEK